MNAIEQAMNVVFSDRAYDTDDQNTCNIDTFADQCLGTSGWWTTDGITFTQLDDFAEQMAVGRALSHCERLANSMFFEERAKDEEKQRKFELQIGEEVEAISYWAARCARRVGIISLEDVVTHIAENASAKAPSKSNDEGAIKLKAEILKRPIEEIKAREDARAEQELVDREKWYVNNAKGILARIKASWSSSKPVYWNPSDQETRWYFESAATKLAEKLPKLEQRFQDCPNDLDRGDESRLRALGLEVLATRAALQSAKDQLAKYPTIASNKEVRDRYDEQFNQLIAAMH